VAESIGGIQSIATIPASVKTVLKRTMVFGMSDVAADRPTFYFDRVATWTDHDTEENPWDWTAAPVTDTTASPVQPICAYEFFSPLGRLGETVTEVGDFNPTTLLVTMFEEEFQAVNGATYCTVKESEQKFYFRYWRPSYYLETIGVHQVHMNAQGAP
jgi:hypothetical protein